MGNITRNMDDFTVKIFISLFLHGLFDSNYASFGRVITTFVF
jgi:hypothetical protein